MFAGAMVPRTSQYGAGPVLTTVAERMVTPLSSRLTTSTQSMAGAAAAGEGA